MSLLEEETEMGLLDSLLLVLKEAGFPLEQYKNFSYIRGGTRDCVVADWGLEKRIFKIDRIPDSKTAKRHVDRGYTTEHEFAIWQAIGKKSPHLTQLRAYRTLSLCTGEEIITEEEFFPSESLEERVRRKPLSPAEVGSVFTQLLAGVKSLHQDAGLYHRDLKPSNILLGEDGTVRITDLANAIAIDKTTSTYMPTAGGHLVSDWRLFFAFTGKAGKYDEQSELYAIGMSLYFAITGQYLFAFDPEHGKATVLATGESLIKNGTFNQEKYERTLEHVLNKLPKDKRKYSDLIHGCLTSQRFGRTSLDTLCQQFADVTRPSMLQRLKKQKDALALGGIAVLALAIGGTVYSLALQTEKQFLQSELEQSKKYEVTAAWNGATLEIANNAVELSVTGYGDIHKGIYPNNIPFIQVKQGERISITPTLSDLPRNDPAYGVMVFNGKVYLEGYPGNDFGIYAAPHDHTKLYDSHGMIGYVWESVDIPQNLPSGMYFVAVELYAPTFKEDERFSYLQPGKVIARKRIPVLVGDSNQTAALAAFNNRFYRPELQIRRVDGEFEDVPNDVQYTVRVLETGAENKDPNGRKGFSNADFLYPPEIEDSNANYTFGVSMSRQGDLIGYSAVPVQGVYIGDSYFAGYQLTLPDSTFCEKLIAFRKHLGVQD